MELEAITKDVYESGVVDSGEKIEYDFDIDLAAKQAMKIDNLQRALVVSNNWEKIWRNAYFKEKIKTHVYKAEMNRNRRKLTRIYNDVKRYGTQELFDRLKEL